MPIETKTSKTDTVLGAAPTSESTTHDRPDTAPGIQAQSETEALVDIAIQAWSRPSEELSGQVLFPAAGQRGAELGVSETPKPLIAAEQSAAVNETGPGNELSRIEDPEAIREIHDAAAAGADALVDLVDQLSGAPLTSQNERAWLEVLGDLEPGPFGKYVVEKIGNDAIEEGPVRNRLLEIREVWQSQYGGKVFYEADLDGLASALSPKSSPGFTNRLLEFGRRLNPFS